MRSAGPLWRRIPEVFAVKQVAVAQHDSLRSTGRARGVQKASDLAGAILLDGLRLRIRIERTNADSAEWPHSANFRTDAAGVIGRFLRKRRVEQHASCAAVSPDQVDLPGREAGINRNAPSSELARRE